MSELIIYNGSLISKEVLSHSPENRGLMYGDGFFDTIRSYQGRFLHLENHFERILETAKYLGISVHFGFEDFKFKILELLEASRLLHFDAIVRVQCWRDGSRGYFTPSKDAHWITSCTKLEFDEKNSIKLSTVNTRAIPSEALERKFKLSNGLNYIVASKEAHELGADDALMLTIQNKVSETTISNVFWISKNQIFTPTVNCDLLPGITRNIIIDLVHKSEHLELIEGVFTENDMHIADAIFCTNSIREIRTVSELNGKKFETENSVLLGLKKGFDLYRNKMIS